MKLVLENLIFIAQSLTEIFIGHSTEVTYKTEGSQNQSSKPKPSLIICMLLLTLSILVHMHVETSQLNFSKWKFHTENLKNHIVLKKFVVIMLTLTSMLSFIISKSKGIIMLLFLVEYSEEDLRQHDG